MTSTVARTDSHTSWEAESSDGSSYVYESGSDDYVFEDDEEVADISPRGNGLLQRLESYNIVDETKLTKFVSDAIEKVESMCGVNRSTAGLLLIVFDWDSDLICERWWEGKDDTEIQASRDKVCKSAGIPRHGPVYEEKGPEPSSQVCVGCSACPKSLLNRAAQGAKGEGQSGKRTRPPEESPKKRQKKKIKKSKGFRKGIKAVFSQLRTVKKFYEASVPDETDISVIEVAIKCKGMWTGVEAFFRIVLPNVQTFPLEAPKKVLAVNPSKMFHPNVDPTDGTVCLSLLSTDWSPLTTLKDVCDALQTLFVCPNWGHSLNAECNTLHEKAHTGEFYQRLRQLGATDPEACRSLTAEINSLTLAASPQVNEDRAAESSPAALFDAPSLMKLPSTSSTHAMACGHFFCKNCWSMFIEAKLKSSVAGSHGFVFMMCPAKGCNTLITEDIVREVSPENLGLFHKGFLETFVQKTERIKYCPRGCGNYVSYPSQRALNREIKCNCGARYCWGCEDDVHIPISCQTKQKWLKGEKAHFCGQSRDDIWMATNVKPCPYCKRSIYKDGGCMHMTCRKHEGGCGKEFCWLCLESWKSHGSGSGGYYACTKYKKAKDSGNVGGLKGAAATAAMAENLAEKRKALIDRYEFHAQRFTFSQSSSKSALGREEAFKVWILESGCENEKAAQQAYALADAASTIAKCRNALAYVYVTKYYMPESAVYKNLFENTHHEFEGLVDKLQSLVEGSAFMDGLGKVDQECENTLTTIKTLVSQAEKFYDDLSRPEDFKSKYLGRVEDEAIQGLEFFTDQVISPVEIWEAKEGRKFAGFLHGKIKK